MIKRTIEISRQPMHLSAKLGQLILQPFNAPKSEGQSVPAEDIGVVLIDHPQVTFTHAAFAMLMQHGACVVTCGPNHLPAGVMLPISSNTEQVTRLREQVDASRPLCKRLWQQLVIAKIKAQAANLDAKSPAHRRLKAMTNEVKSGDTTNVEAQAAKTYWAVWREEFAGFRRDPDASDSINVQLNYGYAVLRAAVARALVAGGLHPALGLHHHNRSNAFCLADDLLEPMRPLVDRHVRELHRVGRSDLDQSNKARLLSMLTTECDLAGKSGPLMVQLHRTVASLVRCYRGEIRSLDVPWPLGLGE